MHSGLSRRYFLQVLAAGAAGTAGALACSGNNGGEPEAFGDVTAGNISNLQVGSVRSISGAPAFIGRDTAGIYAMTSTCSHAGCDMSSSATLVTNIECPCHQSLFNLNGGVVQGPASSPLTHFEVSLATDGTMTVHGATRVSASTRTPAE